MSETERDDLEAFAAEYVLGTLDRDERSAAVARVASDPAFRELVSAWEARLQPLAETATPVAPHADTFDRILSRIDAAPPAADNVVRLRRSIRRWRFGTIVAGAIAATLFGIVVVDRLRPPPTEFVAMLTPGGGEPAFVLTVNTAQNTLSIRRVADAAPADKSYELWAVEPGQNPKSLGVVEQASYTRELPYQPKDLVFAISLEPKGGSPTGKPGEVVFSGALLQSN